MKHNPIEPEDSATLSAILKDTNFAPLSKISYGSYGEIYKITDSDGDYVMKVVSKERMAKEFKLHETLIEGFILSKLDHPGIVRYFQTIETVGHICQVEEYCRFGDLFGVMKKVNKNMELISKKQEIAQFYLAQLLSAIVYLHEKGLIHRDIKMENVVIADNLNAKLIDFGTAKPIKMENFYTNAQIQFLGKLRMCEANEQENSELFRKSFVGSANYLSPQSINLSYSFASDVWSFGIVAYKFFHGKLPFEGQSLSEVFKKIRENDLQINDKVPSQACDLIVQCLNEVPQLRPTAFQLQSHPYFKGINFAEIFKKQSPINKDELLKMYTQSLEEPKEEHPAKDFQYEIVVQKKMFFGNYKPRVLKMYQRRGSLLMSYWYLGGDAPKNEFELQMNDYAEVEGKCEFSVHNNEAKYSFKVAKDENIEKVVQNINSLIRQHFQL